MGSAAASACQKCRAGAEGEDGVGEQHAAMVGSSWEPGLSRAPAISSHASQGSRSAPRKRPWEGHMTVMMFGMTGAGKSSLGNLLVGEEVFEASDDTNSITSAQSLRMYKAPDGSMTLLDTIGLGDTEINDEAVVSSILDTALTAPCGIDVLLFVLRLGRITDDMIARLMYVTEYLWGRECLPNLYTIVTGAARFVSGSVEEAHEWIFKQVEMNWRFRHIFSLCGNDPNKFVFVDNPDPRSKEPFLEQRRGASRQAVIDLLAGHPRDRIAPWSSATMKSVRRQVQSEIDELHQRQLEVQELDATDIKSLNTNGTTSTADTVPEPPAKTAPASAKERPRAEPQPKETKKTLGAAEKRKLACTIAELVEMRAVAIEKGEAAERKLRARLGELRSDPNLSEAVQHELVKATLRFVEDTQRSVDSESSMTASASELRRRAVRSNATPACRRLAGSMSSKLSRKSRPEPEERSAGEPAGDAAAAAEPMASRPSRKARDEPEEKTAGEPASDAVRADEAGGRVAAPPKRRMRRRAPRDAEPGERRAPAAPPPESQP